jgi:hypothetical protein
VRLAPGNAATLYKLVGKHGKSLTRIVVHGKPNSKGPAVARWREDQGPRYARRGYGYYGYPPDSYYSYDAPYYPPARRRAYYMRPPGYYGRYGYGYGF